MSSYSKSGVLPVVTPQGTRMVITKYTKELGDDPSKMDWGTYFKLTVHMADVFLASEGHPVDAEVCIDLENYTVALNNSFVANLSLFKQFVDTAQGSVPLHYKAIHLVNAPGIIKTVIAMVRPFLKDKLGERVSVGRVKAKLVSVPPKCLKQISPALDCRPRHRGELPQMRGQGVPAFGLRW